MRFRLFNRRPKGVITTRGEWRHLLNEVLLAFHFLRSQYVREVAVAVLMSVAIVGFFLLASHFDQVDDLELQNLADQERQLLDLQQRAMLDVQRQKLMAYEAGATDALQAMRETPQGVALAQACLSLGAPR
jgi:nitrogen fixation-related uncharacterized protein